MAEHSLPDILDRIAAARLEDDLLLDSISGPSPEWQEWFFRTHIEKEEPRPAPPTTDSFATTIGTDFDLLEALQLSASAWQLFLHPSQRHAVDCDQCSVAIWGPPGTGKTVVLLERFLANYARGRSTIFATYSRALVQHLRSLTSSLPKRFGHKVIFMEELLRAPQRGTSGFISGDGRLHYVDPGGRSCPVDELLIDEFQDSPRPILKFVDRLFGLPLITIVLAFDLEQAIFQANSAAVLDIANRCESKIEFTFVYRSSREIMRSSSAISSDLHAAISFEQAGDRRVYGLSGPPIVFIEASTMVDQIRRCDEIIRELEQRYDPSQIALIYVQYYNPSFSGKSPEEAALKNHPHLSRYYRFASIVKGQEYMAGVLFVSESYLARQDVGRAGLDLRINAFYVAGTRFRDEVTVVYRRSSPFATLIENTDVVRLAAER